MISLSGANVLAAVSINPTNISGNSPTLVVNASFNWSSFDCWIINILHLDTNASENISRQASTLFHPSETVTISLAFNGIAVPHNVARSDKTSSGLAIGFFANLNNDAKPTKG